MLSRVLSASVYSCYMLNMDISCVLIFLSLLQSHTKFIADDILLQARIGVNKIYLPLGRDFCAL